MNRQDTETLWQRLLGAGLVTGDPPRLPTPTPWFIRLMQGLAGWVGAAFLLFFAGLAFKLVFDSAPAGFLAGALACALAGVLFRVKPDNDFAGQFGLAVSLAGQALIGVALGNQFHHTRLGLVALLMAACQAVLFLALAHPAHRVWSAWAGALALVVALNDWHWQTLAVPLLAAACAALWLNEFRWQGWDGPARAAGYGLALALIMALAFTQGGSASDFGFLVRTVPSRQHWLGPLLCGLVLLATLWQLLERAGLGPRSPAGLRLLAATALLALASWKAPGLAPAVLILLLGFANGERPLFALGVLALLGYLGIYYYCLEATLLFKSGLLLATGAALLVARLVLLRGWPAEAADA